MPDPWLFLGWFPAIAGAGWHHPARGAPLLLPLQPPPPLVHGREKELNPTVINQGVGGLAQQNTAGCLTWNNGL